MKSLLKLRFLFSIFRYPIQWIFCGYIRQFILSQDIETNKKTAYFIQCIQWSTNDQLREFQLCKSHTLFIVYLKLIDKRQQPSPNFSYFTTLQFTTFNYLLKTESKTLLHLYHLRHYASCISTHKTSPKLKENQQKASTHNQVT